MKNILLAILLPLAAVHAQSPKFEPGNPWLDEKGVHINAHGGGILFHEGTYYWCGQFMVEGAAGNTAQVGVSMYSSRDLRQWKNKGRYYLFTSGCTGWKPNPARLASADHVFGPWTELGDPCVGPPEQTRTTFHSQPTCVLPVQGKPGAFIYMGDRWNPANPIEATHVWLPVRFDKEEKPFIQWMDEWDFGFFE